MENIENITSTLSAPWTTILTLASGYAGYFIAHVGNREHHKSIDQAFRVVFYGFWGMFAYVLMRTHAEIGILIASALAILAAALLGAAWRKWGKRCLTKLLRKSGVSMSDDLPSAWSALSEVGEGVDVWQLKVCLTDGTMMFCDDLSRFKNEPNGACVLGGSGDVLMHVTKVGKLDATGKRNWTEVGNVIDPDFGAAITYLPKDQIARIELRRAERL
ncbi:hypothetical protein PVT71_18390 [Salipiger sp. H15]|uniref:Uncharacterized protein n=1 Tax=Alloyangia sp. H15 TaxID=3029062 RepID=A0AAU8APT6_9RHOB